MNKLTRHQIYYQNNQEKLKARRRVRYQIEKKQKSKVIRNQRRKIEKQLRQWKTKLHLQEEAYKYCLWLPFSKVSQIQEKVKELEEKLNKLGKKVVKESCH